MKSQAFCCISSWVWLSIGSNWLGNQVQMGLISREWVCSKKSPLQMGSSCYASADTHRRGVQQSPVLFPSSLSFHSWPIAWVSCQDGSPSPSPPRDNDFCVSQSWAPAGNALRVWALKHQPHCVPLWLWPLYIIVPKLSVSEMSLRRPCLHSLLIFTGIEVMSLCRSLISEAQQN